MYLNHERSSFVNKLKCLICIMISESDNTTMKEGFTLTDWLGY